MGVGRGGLLLMGRIFPHGPKKFPLRVAFSMEENVSPLRVAPSERSKYTICYSPGSF